MLAPLRRSDSDDAIHQKLRIVAGYLDILLTRRIWNLKSTGYSTMQYAMFQLLLKLRRKSAGELASYLVERLNDEEEYWFSDNTTFIRQHHIQPSWPESEKGSSDLARIIDFVECRSGRTSRYSEYLDKGRNGYEVEHIWANHPERHANEFEHPSEFAEYRNRLGGLLLLPKSFNASYGDKPYAEKREHYFGQNLLAQSLHEKAYDHNPGFRKFRDQSDLSFRPHKNFKKADLDARHTLCREIAEMIWSPENLRLGIGA